MGTSTNATLAWGYCWEETMEDLWWEKFQDLDEDEEHENEDVGDWFYNLRGEGIEIGTHCHGDYAMPYICIKESEITAFRS